MNIYIIIFILYTLYYISIFCYDRFKKGDKFISTNEEYKVLKFSTIKPLSTNLETSSDNLVIKNVNIDKIVTDIEKNENAINNHNIQMKDIKVYESSGENFENNINDSFDNRDFNINDTDDDFIQEEFYTDDDCSDNQTYTLDEIFNQEKELFQSFSQNKIAMLANLLEASIITNQDNDQDPILTDFINKTESLTAIDLTDDSAIKNHLDKIAHEKNITPSNI